MTGSCINNREPELSVLDIVEGTSVDGVGLRTSIYFEGCHNPQSWNMANGKKYSVDTLYDIVRGADMNVTFSGGDPMLQAGALCALARRIKEECGKTIWCYTGYLFENLLTRPDTRELLAYIDVLVDGPFILAERDLSLRFRGSRNQRLIDVRRSISGKQTVEFQL